MVGNPSGQQCHTALFSNQGLLVNPCVLVSIACQPDNNLNITGKNFSQVTVFISWASLSVSNCPYSWTSMSVRDCLYQLGEHVCEKLSSSWASMSVRDCLVNRCRRAQSIVGGTVLRQWSWDIKENQHA